jgi:hypothetical protein
VSDFLTNLATRAIAGPTLRPRTRMRFEPVANDEPEPLLDDLSSPAAPTSTATATPRVIRESVLEPRDAQSPEIVTRETTRTETKEKRIVIAHEHRVIVDREAPARQATPAPPPFRAAIETTSPSPSRAAERANPAMTPPPRVARHEDAQTNAPPSAVTRSIDADAAAPPSRVTRPIDAKTNAPPPRVAPHADPNTADPHDDRQAINTVVETRTIRTPALAPPTQAARALDAARPRRTITRIARTMPPRDEHTSRDAQPSRANTIAATPDPPEPTIHVSIGRVEVRAVAPASPPARRTAPQPMSIDEYVARNDARGRR